MNSPRLTHAQAHRTPRPTHIQTQSPSDPNRSRPARGVPAPTLAPRRGSLAQSQSDSPRVGTADGAHRPPYMASNHWGAWRLSWPLRPWRWFSRVSEGPIKGSRRALGGSSLGKRTQHQNSHECFAGRARSLWGRRSRFVGGSLRRNATFTRCLPLGLYNNNMGKLFQWNPEICMKFALGTRCPTGSQLSFSNPMVSRNQALRSLCL